MSRKFHPKSTLGVHKKLCPLVHIDRMRIIGCGAQQCAAHSLHRLTRERPAPATNRRADPALIRRLEQGAHVSGDWYRVQAEATNPSLALGLQCSEASVQMEKVACMSPCRSYGRAA